MPERTKIVVALTRRNYRLIRQRVETVDDKTSRVLSRYLYIFMTMLADGERTLFRKFTTPQGRAMAETLNRVHREDGHKWEELSMYPAARLSRLLEAYGCDDCVPLSTVEGLTSCEMLALVEYARTMCDAARFESQTARFRVWA